MERRRLMSIVNKCSHCVHSHENVTSSLTYCAPYKAYKDAFYKRQVRNAKFYAKWLRVFETFSQPSEESTSERICNHYVKSDLYHFCVGESCRAMYNIRRPWDYLRYANGRHHCWICGTALPQEAEDAYQRYWSTHEQ